MHAFSRQLRIWKHELLEAWSRVPFYGHVVFGAGIALGLSLFCVKQVLNPLNMELIELRENLFVTGSLDPEKNEEIIMDRDRAAKLRVSLKSWKELLSKFQSQAIYLQASNHLEVVSEVQAIIDRCGLLLVSENMEVPEVENPAMGRHRRSPPEPKNEDPMGRFTHEYEVQGGFRQIQAFLLLLEQLEWRISLHDLELKPVGKERKALSLRFVLDIHYFKEGS